MTSTVAVLPAPLPLRTRAGALARRVPVVRLGAGAIALHVIDDAFLQPQPGTSAGDHLVSGLAPLALLALAAWAYTRLSGGRRGALALALGALAFAAGGEAFYYGNETGLSGDDYTGLLALAAAPVLLGAGAVTLWRTRRTDGSLRRRAARRTLYAAAGVLTFAFVVLPVGMEYVDTHTARALVPAADLGAPHEDVRLTTSDGLELHGWYVPSRNGAAVIAFPGRKGPQASARMLIRQGYGVLLFDRRGEGESDGDPNGWGWGGDRDLQAAIAYLKARPDVDPGRIGGLGLSVGGELMIETAAEHGGLAAVASEGAGIRSVREITALPAPAGDKLLILPFKAASTVASAVFTNRTPPPNLVDLVADVAPTPLLLMYSPTGQGGEVELNPEFHRRAPGSQLWRIDGAGHASGSRDQPAAYERRIVGFFDAALLR
jgi:hypothetical protein